MWGIYGELAELIVTLIYLFILLITIGGVFASLMVKSKWFAVWWVSLNANVFCVLYFLGNSTFWGWMARIFSITVWPLINIVFAGYLIYRAEKKKDKNKK